MLIELSLLMALGFGLGALHALDADHIMAVTALSNRKVGVKQAFFYSSYWALGHGFVLLASGILLFGLGFSIPPRLQYLAEASVGVLLIILGIACFIQFRKDNLSLSMHRHGDVVHTHWQHKGTEHADKSTHKPVFVGLLHGLAGSAPALALMPAVASGEIVTALGYLLLFSVGVMLSMMLFGLGFAQIQQFLQRRYRALFTASRYLLASVSILLGGFWLIQAL